MWTYHADLLATPVPRYTSYPTAMEFRDDFNHSKHDVALEEVRAGTRASLYVHIPFCRELCWYCGCNTARNNRAQRLNAYIEALHGEIDAVARRVAGRIDVARIAFGGGSPNAVDATTFAGLVAHLRAAFGIADVELSVEIDPRDFDDVWAEGCAIAGVTHASLGVQTLDPALQARIGRVQPEAMIARAAELLRAAGTRSLNFDLMYGLPGQDKAALLETLDAASAYAPDRIALFGYAHVPAMFARQQRIDASALPDQVERFAMAETGHAALLAKGYRAVGFDHFALPHDGLALAAAAGTVHRNFQGFTDDAAPVLIGFGASAISLLPGAILQNEKNNGRYRMLISGGLLPAAKGLILTEDDRRRARTIEDLLCERSASIAGLAADAAARTRLEMFVTRGLARLDGGRLSVTDAGRPYARSIAALFDAYRPQSTRQFSSAI